MSRYQPLADFLARQKGDRWDATFADIEAALGRSLPRSAYRYPAWWANQASAGHSQTQGWKSVGWRTTALDLARGRVSFERDSPNEEKRFAGDSEGLEPLLSRAGDLTGIADRQRLLIEGLKALIVRETAMNLAALGGSMPDFVPPVRERP